MQDIINSNVSAGLNIIEMAEMSALDASFWYTYDELKSLKSEEHATINGSNSGMGRNCISKIIAIDDYFENAGLCFGG